MGKNFKSFPLWPDSFPLWPDSFPLWPDSFPLWPDSFPLWPDYHGEIEYALALGVKP